jgi:molybdenum cofactor cytidylyltransferase
MNFGAVPASEAGPMAAPERSANIAAIVLAAGLSSRMGGTNKLLAALAGGPVIRHTCRNTIAAGVSPVIVVTGRDSYEIAACLTGLDCELAYNSDFASGMASSIRAGIRTLPSGCDAALICLGDMPAVKPATLKALIAVFDPLEDKSIVVPVFKGKRGNPALFDKALFPELMKLSGDHGARRLVEANADLVCEVPVEDEGVLMDADTPEALLRLERLMARDENDD